MNNSSAAHAITINVAEALPLQIVRSIDRVSARFREAPLRLNIISSGSQIVQLAVSEANILRFVINTIVQDTVCINELTIHTEFRSSLPHPVYMLYTSIGRYLRRLILHYYSNNGVGILGLAVPPPSATSFSRHYGSLVDLSVSGNVLLDLLAFDRSHNLSIPLVNLCSFDIVNFSDCLTRLSVDHIQLLVGVLQSLTKLTSLRVEEFGIPAHLQKTLAGLIDTFPGISLRRVTVIRTNGDSLLFLLRRLIPDELMLDECSTIIYLPHCTTLSLLHIPSSNGFVNVLSEWDGESLDILSCPFFGNTFLAQLRDVSRARGEPLWRHLRYVNVQDCRFTFAEWLQVLELRSQRMGFLPTPSSRRPVREQKLRQWASELAQSVTVIDLPNV